MESRSKVALAEAIGSPSFTPAVRDLTSLMELLGEPNEKLAIQVERALLRMGPPLLPLAMAQLETAGPPLRARLCKLIGRSAGTSEEVRTFLVAHLGDPDAKCRRYAIAALGKVKDPAVEEALLGIWPREDYPEHRRTLVEALGNCGGERAASLLQGEAQGIGTADPELAKILERALLKLGRTADRRGEGHPEPYLNLSARPSQPLPLLLRCRRGLEGILAQECQDRKKGIRIRPNVPAEGLLHASLSGSLEEVYSLRTLLGAGFPLPLLPLEASPEQDDALAQAIFRALRCDRTQEILQCFGSTKVPARFRLQLVGAGHRRGLMWKVAALFAQDPYLRNDPVDSSWEIEAEVRGRNLQVVLWPKRFLDPRFQYRKAEVPASSHPTIAAALARVAGVMQDDVVWDPFVGSGLELIERSYLGPAQVFWGTDVDPAALIAAEKNLQAAGVSASLALGDARTFRLPPPLRPTLILTNPPMGRRLHRDGQLFPLLASFLENAANALAPNGRLVWLSPMPERSAREAQRLRLRLRSQTDVDMGGYFATLQVLEKGKII